MIDGKQIYMIYDVKGHTYGELMTFTNDLEATRSFIYACANTGFFEDLLLLCVGKFDFYDIDKDLQEFSSRCIPDFDCSHQYVVCYGSDLVDDVESVIKKNNEKSIAIEEMRKSYANKFEQHFDSLFKLRKVKGGK